MKKIIPVFLLLQLAIMVSGDPAKLGTLNRDSDVMVEGLYPVFQIWVPDGVTEVQIRASTNNFQNSFELRKDGVRIYSYFCRGTKNGRNWYSDTVGTRTTYWSTNNWFIDTDEGAGIGMGTGIFPWSGSPSIILGGHVYTCVETPTDDKFCYRWCSTGQDADGTWDFGVQDGDAELFFSNQKGNTVYSEFQMQRWLGDTTEAYFAGYPNTSLTAQMQPTGTPGRYVIFQPSRAAHLFLAPNGDWMRQSNKHLQWVVQYETVAGWETHPDGSPVWSAIRPVEWRAERLELQEAK